MELVLSTYGTALNRAGNSLQVIAGQRKQKISVCDIRAIHIGPGVQLTSDALMLAIEHEIEILLIDRAGTPIGRVWSPKYGSISTIRKGQLAFTQSVHAVAWIKEELQKKISNQQALLLLLNNQHGKGKCRRNDKAVERMEDYKKKIAEVNGLAVHDIAPKLRGWEGSASRIYFDEMNRFLPERYRFESRSQHPALDIANAFLNYGYGILYGRVEEALIKAGIDPYIGILHRDEYNRPVLVYDVIERYRIWVDYVVYGLLSQLEIDDSYYSVDDDGSYWLEALGRRVLVQSMNDYLEDVTTIGSMQRSRNWLLQQDAYDLAKLFGNQSTQKTTK